MITLVDTGVLIDALRRLPEALSFLSQRDAQPYASEVTRVELLQGVRSHERSDAEKSHSGVGVADLVIAATTELFGLSLATTNAKHFPMFSLLRPPY